MIRAGLTLASALAFIGFSYAAPEFRGYTVDQLPLAEAQPAIQPAGWAFAIWGLIYAGLLASAVFGLVRRAEAPDWAAHRLPLSLAMVLGAAWLWIAGQDAVAATAVIFAMLTLALWALARAPARDPWLARVPIGLLAGWLTAAAFVSLGVTLAGLGLVPGSRWAAIALVPAAALVALTVVWRLAPAGAYAVAAGWGLVGIAAQNWGRDDPLLAALALGAAAALGAAWALGRRLAGPPAAR